MTSLTYAADLIQVSSIQLHWLCHEARISHLSCYWLEIWPLWHILICYRFSSHLKKMDSVKRQTWVTQCDWWPCLSNTLEGKGLSIASIMDNFHGNQFSNMTPNVIYLRGQCVNWGAFLKRQIPLHFLIINVFRLLTRCLPISYIQAILQHCRAVILCMDWLQLKTVK